MVKEFRAGVLLNAHTFACEQQIGLSGKYKPCREPKTAQGPGKVILMSILQWRLNFPSVEAPLGSLLYLVSA